MRNNRKTTEDKSDIKAVALYVTEEELVTKLRNLLADLHSDKYIGVSSVQWDKNVGHICAEFLITPNKEDFEDFIENTPVYSWCLCDDCPNGNCAD